MGNVPSDLKYTKEHEWVGSTANPQVFRVGITDFAQGALGDIVYIQLPKVGDQLTADKVCGEVESTKSVSEIYAPVSGKVTRVNEKLESNPELINSDPFGECWIAEISNVERTEKLLTAAEYANITA